MNQSSGHSMFYIAIVCPPHIEAEVSRMKLWMKQEFGCVAASRSPAHITIVPPFWLTNERMQELKEVFSGFSSVIEEQEILLSGFGHFDKKVLFIDVKENMFLTELQVDAQRYFKAYFGKEIKNDKRPFHPHVTIATRDIKPSAFIRAWEYFTKRGFEDSFRTAEICLLISDQGKWKVHSVKDWRKPG